VGVMKDIEKRERSSEENTGNFNQDVLSKVIRAGKRTYFFDVKSTRNKELYLIITESKKHMENDGNFSYEKHKIFLYQEDFEHFSDTFQEVREFIEANQPPRLPHSDINEDVDFGG
jgi:hypothetical protein